MHAPFLLLFLTSTLAGMEPETNTSATPEIATHRFAGIIRPRFASDYICLVKSFPNEDEPLAPHLVAVVDRKGLGEFFMIDENTAMLASAVSSSFYLTKSFARSCYNRQSAPRHMLKCRDHQGQPLLAFLTENDNTISLYSFTNNDEEEWRTLALPEGKKFRLYTNATQEPILQETHPKQQTFQLALYWNPDKHFRLGKAKAEIGYKKVDSDQVSAPKDAGVIVSDNDYKGERILKPELFDFATCPQEHKKYMEVWGLDRKTDVIVKTMRSISCYHKTLNNVYFLGHDGLVSVWVPKTTTIN